MISNGKKTLEIIRNGSSISEVVRNNEILYTKEHPNLIARYSAKGRTNQDSDRDCLYDLTGNGYDIQLKNFGWNKNSGYSSPPISLKYLFPEAKLLSSFSIDLIANSGYVEYFSSGTETIPSYKIKVEGLREEEIFFVIDVDEYLLTVILTVEKDGIYTVPEMKYVDKEYIMYDFQCWTASLDHSLIITVLADYPDGLVFDGIDDYGFVDNFTCKDDYTVIINREWFNITGDRVLLSKRGIPTDFHYGEFEVEKRHYSYSYGLKSRVNIEPPIIMNKRETIYQTKTSYNGTIPIIPGSEIPTSQLILGAGIRTTDGQAKEFFSGVIYDLIIYDRTLSSAEIEKEILKYNL